MVRFESEGESEQVEALMKETLEKVVDWNVPLVVTTRRGKDWAKVSK